MKYTLNTLEHSLSSGMSLDINRHIFQLMYQGILDLKSRNKITSLDPKCHCHVIKGFTAYDDDMFTEEVSCTCVGAEVSPD